MSAPIPPKDLSEGFVKEHFGPLPKCEHGFIKAICAVCDFSRQITSKRA